jgi:hypothetical protein
MENRHFHFTHRDNATAFRRRTPETVLTETTVYHAPVRKPSEGLSEVAGFTVPYPYHLDEYVADDMAFNEHHGLSLT